MPHLDWTTGALALLRAHLGDYGARAFGGFASLPVLALLFAWLERIRPLVRQRPRPSDTDLAYYLSSPCFDLLSRGAAALCMAAWATLAGTQQQSALLSGFGPVVEQPRGLIWVEMLLLLELLAYGSHRLFHSVPFLWRFHAVHHSSTRMGWLSAVRRHPFNDLVSHCLNATVLFALGFPIDVAMQVLPLIAMHALLTHSNLDWRFGKLSSVLVSPIYHRFHHTLVGADGVKLPGLAPYGATKAGVRYLSRALAREAKPSGVIVATVDPGVVATDALAALYPTLSPWVQTCTRVLAQPVDAVAPRLVRRMLDNERSGVVLRATSAAAVMARLARALLPGRRALLTQ